MPVFSVVLITIVLHNPWMIEFVGVEPRIRRNHNMEELHMWRVDCKLHAHFRLHGGLAHAMLNPMMFKGQLYFLLLQMLPGHFVDYFFVVQKLFSL